MSARDSVSRTVDQGSVNRVRRESERVHPCQVALRGGTASDRELLAERLGEALSSEFLVGNARFEEPDVSQPAPPKLADRSPAGPTAIFSDTTGSITSGPGPAGLFERRYALLGCDLVLSQHDTQPDAADALPEVLLSGAQDGGSGDGKASAQAGTSSDVIATVGTQSGPQASAVPHFAPANVAGLAEEIRRQLLARASRTPVYGLVLAGGRSTRMGRAKWALEYHGEPQALALHRLLSRHCERTFLSIHPGQQGEPELTRLPHVSDRFLGLGPVGGILSAMVTHPEAAWLVVACDMPFVSDATVERLLRGRAPLRFATTYVSPHDGLPEPLCAIYEPKARLRLAQLAGMTYSCPRKLLMNARIRLIGDVPAQELTNANHPHEYERAVATLSTGGPK